MRSRIIAKLSARWLIVIALTVMAFLVLAMPAMAQSAGEKSFTEIYESASPGVVAISVTKDIQVQSSAPILPDNEQVAGGTGFVIDTSGHIVTNYHVVESASEIEVQFLDGTLARAQVVGLDPDSDLAVIRVLDVPTDRLHPLQFADSDTLQVGETVLAIGSPFGERWTLTSGIISALDRTIRGMSDFSIGGVIQTDAAINPGNSGGPLLNMQGEVIGVNSQIISNSRSSSGIGFSIPANLTRFVAQQLIENGSVEYSYLGISGGNVSLDLLEIFNLPNTTRGVVVSQVMPNGPAADAGLHAMGNPVQTDSGSMRPSSMDIITAVNGTPLNTMEELISYLAQRTRPGDQVTLTILRDGTQTLQLTVNLTARP